MKLSSHRGVPVMPASPTAVPEAVPESGAAVEVVHLRKTYGATVAVDDV